jgi:D-alanyl-D-alanine carboxypeptidase
VLQVDQAEFTLSPEVVAANDALNKWGDANCSSATTTTEIAPAAGGDFLFEQVYGVFVPEGKGAFMVAVVDASGSVEYAGQGFDPSGGPLTPDAVFRIGNITRVFTAALTLTLVDDGVVDLEAPVTDYVTRVRVPDDVTVRDLLQHTSGIPNWTLLPPNPWSRALDDPQRVWLPEETIGLVEDREPNFEPGARFSYSNTNYSILGVLIEEVTGLPFAAALRERILEPLGLDSTYLDGFEEGQDPFGAYSLVGATNPSWNTAELIDFEYTAIATQAWAAGAMVSSVEDLHAFLSALFDEQVISAESLAAMTSVISAESLNAEYGLGIARSSDFGELYGHGGVTPGYGTFVMHAPDTGKTAVWVATNDTIRFDGTIDAVAESISQD